MTALNKSFTTSTILLSLISSPIAFILSVIVFRASLDYVYIGFLSPAYTQSFLSFKFEYEMSQYLISWVMYLLALTTLKHKLETYSSFIFVLAVLSLIAPLTSEYGLNASKSIYPVLVTIGSMFVIYTITRFGLFKSPRVPYYRNGRRLIIVLSWLFVALLIMWYIVSGGASNINFDPSRVYEFRAENSKITDIGVLAYFNLWVYKFFTIFLISYALYKKNIFIVLLLLGIQLFFYGVNAHKITVFLPFVAISIWFYFRKNDLLIVVPLSYIAIVFIAYWIYLFFNDEMAGALLIRRAFFVPAGLTFEWFDYFSNNPHVFWSDKILAPLIDSPYKRSIPFTVGEHLLSPELAANNGFISSGFAHAGVLGVFIYSILLGYVIKVLDMLGRTGVPLWFMLALTVGPVRTVLLDSDLLTAFVSHGVLLSIVILILFRSKEGASNMRLASGKSYRVVGYLKKL